jgi:hypothetical protein
MENRIGLTVWARKTLDSEIFSTKPDKWFKIWFFLVNRVNYEDNSRFKRGECFTNYKEIADITGASDNEIKHCIAWMKRATDHAPMITTRKATRGMVLSVVNFAEYQDKIKNKSHTKSHTTNHTGNHKGNHTIVKEVNKEEENKQSLEIKISDAGLQNNEVKTPSSIKGKKSKTPREISDASVEENKQIGDIIKTFKEKINPLLRYDHPPERSACLRLLREVGAEEAQKALNYYITIKDGRYVKTITTPREFEKNFAWIGQYSLKINNQ